jgi:ketosteroid isomerase-like protein
MSRDTVEVVRALQTPWEGRDTIGPIREALERFGPDPQPQDVLALWAQDPGWRHVHPDIEWDTTAAGALGTVAHGAREVASWWADWVQAWQSYVFQIVEYRDLGDWVLTPVDVRARTREGMDVEMRSFQLWGVREGKVAIQRAFLTEREALESAALPENDISPERIEQLVRWAYDWFNREKEPPPSWLPDGEFVNAREDPDHSTYRGIEAIRKQHQGWFDSYPDLRVEPLEIRVNGDRVFVWARFTGHGAESGAALEMELAHVLTLEGERTRRLEEYMDRAEALEALGLRE